MRNNQQQMRPSFIPGQFANNQINQTNLGQQVMPNIPMMNNFQQTQEMPHGVQQY
jgi:hypothetical protein